MNADKPSFWTTLPGILTGIAAVIGAITALLAATGHFSPPTNVQPQEPVNKVQVAQSPDHAPVAIAASNDTTEGKDKNVTLDGSMSRDPDGDKLTYLWNQISGDPVNLRNKDKPIAIFDTPNVTEDTQLGFHLTVDDNRGLSNTTTVEAKVINNQSNDADLFYNRGWNFHLLGREKEATKNYDEALNINPNYAGVYSVKCLSLDKLGNYAEAIKNCDKALSIDQNDSSAWINKGVVFVDLKNYAEAIKYYNKALDIDPSNDIALGDKKLALDNIKENRTLNEGTPNSTQTSFQYRATIASINVGDNPQDITINPKTNLLYVTNFNSNTTSVIDGKTNKVLTNIGVGAHPTGVAVNPTANMIYVANMDSNTTSVIDGETDKVLTNIGVGNSPVRVAVNPTTNMIYVANKFSNNVSVIDGKTNNVITTIDVENFPFGVAVNPNTNMIYVTHSGSSYNTTSVMDGKTDKVLGTAVVEFDPEAITVNPDTNMVYVVNTNSNTVSLLIQK